MDAFGHLDGSGYCHLLLLQPEAQQTEDFITERVIRIKKTPRTYSFP
jgi:hypothetical protein